MSKFTASPEKSAEVYQPINAYPGWLGSTISGIFSLRRSVLNVKRAYTSSSVSPSKTGFVSNSDSLNSARPLGPQKSTVTSTVQSAYTETACVGEVSNS